MPTLVEIKIVKNVDGQPPASEWSNSYHIEMSAEMNAGDAGGVGIESDLFRIAAEKLMDFEKNIHVPLVRILRAVCTTPETGDDNLPEHLRVVPYGQLGRHESGPDDVLLPFNTVFKISFAGKTGRAGANSYRGVLWQSDVTVSSGGYKLRPVPNQNLLDTINQGIANTGIRNNLRIVSVKAGVVTSRFVASIQIAGVSNRQRTQKKRRQTDAEVLQPPQRLTRGIDDLIAAQTDLALRYAKAPDDPAIRAEALQFNRLIGLIPTFGVLP